MMKLHHLICAMFFCLPLLVGAQNTRCVEKNGTVVVQVYECKNGAKDEITPVKNNRPSEYLIVSIFTLILLIYMWLTRNMSSGPNRNFPIAAKLVLIPIFGLLFLTGKLVWLKLVPISIQMVGHGNSFFYYIILFLFSAIIVAVLLLLKRLFFR